MGTIYFKNKKIKKHFKKIYLKDKEAFKMTNYYVYLKINVI